MIGCSCAGADTGSSINAVKGRGARRNAAVTVIVSKEPLRFDVSPTAEWILRAQNALMPLPQRRDRRHGRPQAALQDLYRACRRMGRRRGDRQGAARTERGDQGAARAARDEPAGRLTMVKLRLSRRHVPPDLTTEGPRGG